MATNKQEKREQIDTEAMRYYREFENYGSMRIEGNLAYSDLVNLYNDLVVKTNRQLRVLEKNRMTTWSYNNMIDYIQSDLGGKNRMEEKPYIEYIDKEATAEELLSSIKHMTKFLYSESSTVAGNKRIRNRLMDMFSEHGVDVDSPTVRKSLYHLVQSPAWEYMKNVAALSSDDAIDLLAAVTKPGSDNNGYTPAQIINQLSKLGEKGDFSSINKLLKDKFGLFYYHGEGTIGYASNHRAKRKK